MYTNIDLKIAKHKIECPQKSFLQHYHNLYNTLPIAEISFCRFARGSLCQLISLGGEGSNGRHSLDIL